MAEQSRADLARHSYAKRILGADIFARIADAKLLVVGAGGIGCELLKNLVLIDLDTIDLSNLNRQFLFQKQHIKKSKALVARDTASAFNPSVNIIAHHGNIKDAEFGLAYFEKFDMVLNALDNLDARRWVNRMCAAANVPLVESGTEGFMGQVQPIVRGETECFDCVAHDSGRKRYPVCTIRSTPTAPVHCIVWAKDWLFTQLFGADDETGDAELEAAAAEGENPDEINSLRLQAREMLDLRSKLKDVDAAERVFDKVYRRDTERLLSMEDMWKARVKPTPLVFQVAKRTTDDGGAPTTLRDQKKLSLAENVELFETSLRALVSRNSTDPLDFDKDDEDAMDFITAAANLRSYVYNIERKTRFDIKQIAGNIIPAIATTNAIIAGMIVLQSLHVLRKAWKSLHIVSLRRIPELPISKCQLGQPNPSCEVCHNVAVRLPVNNKVATLGTIVNDVAPALGVNYEFALSEGTRLLYDPDFEDNLEKPLSELNLTKGSILYLVDEDNIKVSIHIHLEDTIEEGKTFTIPEHLPSITHRPVKKEIAPDSDDDEILVAMTVEEAGAMKKAEAEAAAASEAGSTGITRKRDAGDEGIEEQPTKKRKSGGGQDAESAIEID